MLPGSGLIQDGLNYGNKNSQPAAKLVTWEDVKKNLVVETPNGDTLNLIVQANIKENEIDELIRFYQLAKDDALRLELFKKLSNSIKTNPKVLDLCKKVAANQDRILAPIALKQLLYAELSKDVAGKDQWTNWQWSQDVKKLLEEAVNKSMYKLSGFEYLQILTLANRYPDSLLTQGAKEYRDFVGGNLYFGYRDFLPENQKNTVLRQPFFPQKELIFWKQFFKKYPDHPGTDDAMYRLARSYEIQKDYENAILWYYKASQAPDGDMNAKATKRMLFLIDSVMSSNSLAKFITANYNHPLIPYLTYSKAVYLIREDNILESQSELEKFVSNYKNSRLTGVIRYSPEGSYLGANSKFWSNVQQQINNLKKLTEIRSLPLTDKRLYDEGSFWFYNYLTAYNYLWRGSYVTAFLSFIPEKWEGVNTVIQKSINFNLVEVANQSYEFQNGSLKSIGLFQKLLKEYPNSELKEKAQYSIALAYYYLANEGWSNLSDQDTSWRDMAIKSFYNFVSLFPKSSLADDALLSIAYIGGVDKAIALQALERLLNEYPNGDRKKEAEKKIEELRGKIPPQNILSSSSVYVGIGMDHKYEGKGVLILYAYPNLPASKAGLRGGDIIMQVDGQSVFSVYDVASIIQRHRIGESVYFKIEREGQTKVVEVTTALHI